MQVKKAHIEAGIAGFSEKLGNVSTIERPEYPPLTHVDLTEFQRSPKLSSPPPLPHPLTKKHSPTTVRVLERYPKERQRVKIPPVP